MNRITAFFDPSRRGRGWTCGLAFALVAAGFSNAQTFTITDVSAPGTNPSFATGVNTSGQVSGYSTTGANAAQAWRFTSGTGTVSLGSFGGADSRALGINDSGSVTGYSTDAAGFAHGFVFSDANGLVDIGGNGGGAPISRSTSTPPVRSPVTPRMRERSRRFVFLHPR